MSARHGWLRFRSTGHPLPTRLDDDPRPWQAVIVATHRRWYGPDAPIQVAGAFVLQYLLQVPAHAAAAAAGVGMRVPGLPDLTVDLGPGGVPRLVELGAVEPAGVGPLEPRLAQAEADYLAVAGPLARAYVSTRRMSTHQRRGMVADMWTEASRAVRTATGAFALAEPRRVSCCLVYALPGCLACSGCPRQTRR